ncbi:hypothetical protein M8J75_007492 [Diaphorina citri]|nr:hypothetical protein M8J75_007492 [Diaphorina citri]
MAPLAGGSHSSLSIDAFLLESFQVWVARPRFCLVNVLDRISDPDFDTSNRSYPKDLKKSPNTEDFEYKSRLPESTRAVYLVNVKLMAKAVQQLKQIIIDKVKTLRCTVLRYSIASSSRIFRSVGQISSLEIGNEFEDPKGQCVPIMKVEQMKLSKDFFTNQKAGD